jgi:membrane-bound ClpP family serine protease
MKIQLTHMRLISAITSMALEQAGIFAVWRWLLPVWDINLDAWVVVLAMLVWLIIGLFLYITGTGALNRKEVAGLSSMVDMEGEALTPINPRGTVMIDGEIWNARSETGEIATGETIIVTGEDGLKLIVRKHTHL